VTATAFTLDAAEVATAMAAQVVPAARPRVFDTVSTDSRTIDPGALYFAIPGPRFDGHAFVGDAVRKGAAAVVVSNPAALDALAGAVTGFVVTDTVAALQALARHVRRRSGARVVAITGSAGKTTTKEAIAALLSSRFTTIRNRGNLNNHIGLPLSLMALTHGAEGAVMELGMNHAGEIRQLVSIAEPDVRVWTNVGTAHIEFFGTMDAIADAKAEILDDGDRAVLVANADDPRVMSRAARFAGRTLTFGIDQPADVRAVEIEDRGFQGMRASLATPAGRMHVYSALAGRGHLRNVLAAVATAIHFGVPASAIVERIAELRPAPHRGEVLRLPGDVVVVDDCYNASPSAVRELLQTAAGDPSSRRRVAFLGEMLELGAASEALHAESGRLVAETGVAVLVTAGGAPARALADAAVKAGVTPQAVVRVSTSDEAALLVPTVVRPGDLVLVKGSRGIHMERVVERLVAEFD
jgi:UDP-N-acetylmuramoyl-tripeptide--D-alanyl-D-alanine ligase